MSRKFLALLMLSSIMIATSSSGILLLAQCSEDETDQEEIVVNKPDLEKDKNKEKDKEKEKEQKEKEEQEKQREREEKEQKEKEEQEKQREREEKERKEKEEKDKLDFKEFITEFEKKSKSYFQKNFVNDYEVKSTDVKLQNLLNEGFDMEKKNISSKNLDFNHPGLIFFKNKFNNIAKMIMQDHFNSKYPEAVVTLLSNEKGIKGTMYSIQTNTVKILDSKYAKMSDLKIARIKLEFHYELNFKKIHRSTSKYEREFYITNNLKFKNDIQKKVSESFNKLIYENLKTYDIFNETKMKSLWNTEGKYPDSTGWSWWGYYWFNLETMVKNFLLRMYDKFIDQKIKLYVKNTLKNSETFVKISSDIFEEQENNFTFFNISDLSDIYEKFYKKASSYNSEYRADMQKEITKTKLNSLNLSDYGNEIMFYKCKINLEKISFAGFKMEEKYVYNPSTNEPLEIKFFYGKNSLAYQLTKAINWITAFFHYYELQIINKEVIIITIPSDKYDQEVKDKKFIGESLTKLLNSLVKLFEDNSSIFSTVNISYYEQVFKGKVSFFGKSSFSIKFYGANDWKVRDDWINDFKVVLKRSNTKK